MVAGRGRNRLGLTGRGHGVGFDLGRGHYASAIHAGRGCARRLGLTGLGRLSVFGVGCGLARFEHGASNHGDHAEGSNNDQGGDGQHGEGQGHDEVFDAKDGDVQGHNESDTNSTGK